MKRFLSIALAALTLHGQNANLVTIIPNAADNTVGRVRFRELRSNGANYLDLLIPDALAADYVITLPAVGGTVMLNNSNDTVVGTKTFSARVQVNNTLPAFEWYESDAAADEKLWRMYADSGALRIAAVNDADSAQTTSVFWDRVGATAGSFNTLVDIVPFTSVTSNLGGASNYWDTTFSKNIDAATGGVTNNYTKVRKLEIADAAGGTSFWDVQATANGSVSSSFYIRDNAGVYALNIVRQASGIAYDYADVYVDLYPDTNAGQSLGSASKRWNGYFNDIDISGTVTGFTPANMVTTDTTQTVSGEKTFSAITYLNGGLQSTAAAPTWQMYQSDGGADEKYWRLYYEGSSLVLDAVNDAYSAGTAALTITRSGITPGTMTAAMSILPGTTNTYDVGTSSLRYGTFYGHNFDGAPSGATGNYLKTRKIDIADASGATAFWDIQSAVAGGTSSLTLRDNSGVNAIQFVRQAASVAQDYANVYVDLRPDTTLGQSLGSSSFRWSSLYVNGIDAGDIVPRSNNAYDLGSITAQWRDVFAEGQVYANDVIAANTLYSTGGVSFTNSGSFKYMTNESTHMAFVNLQGAHGWYWYTSADGYETGGNLQTRMYLDYNGNLTVPGSITATGGFTGFVPDTRLINTTSPLTGGGDLSGDLTLDCPTCLTTDTVQTISAVKTISATHLAFDRATPTTGSQIQLRVGGDANDNGAWIITTDTNPLDVGAGDDSALKFQVWVGPTATGGYQYPLSLISDYSALSVGLVTNGSILPGTGGTGTIGTDARPYQTMAATYGSFLYNQTYYAAGGTNEKYWRWDNAGNTLTLIAINDAYSGTNALARFTRTGIAATLFEVFSAVSVPSLTASSSLHSAGTLSGTTLNISSTSNLVGSTVIQGTLSTGTPTPYSVFSTLGTSGSRWSASHIEVGNFQYIIADSPTGTQSSFLDGILVGGASASSFGAAGVTVSGPLTAAGISGTSLVSSGPISGTSGTFSGTVFGASASIGGALSAVSSSIATMSGTSLSLSGSAVLGSLAVGTSGSTLQGTTTISTASVSTLNVSGTTTGNAIIGSTLNASSWVAAPTYYANGNPGITSNLSCPAGQAVKSININAGIVIGVSCGVP